MDGIGTWRRKPLIQHPLCGVMCSLSGQPHGLWGLGGISPILQMEKLREGKQFAQRCPAAKWWVWDLNPGFSSSKAVMVLTTEL